MALVLYGIPSALYHYAKSLVKKNIPLRYSLVCQGQPSTPGHDLPPTENLQHPSSLLPFF